MPITLLLNLLGRYKYYGIILIVLLGAGVIMIPVAKALGIYNKPPMDGGEESTVTSQHSHLR